MTDNPEAVEYHANPQCSECGCLMGNDEPVFIRGELFVTWQCETYGTQAVTFEGGDEIINQSYRVVQNEETSQQHKIWDEKRKRIVRDAE